MINYEYLQAEEVFITHLFFVHPICNLFQSCQRYCLQKDIADVCNCFHPNLVQATSGLEDIFKAKLNTTFGYSPCLITPSENSMNLFSQTNNLER